MTRMRLEPGAQFDRYVIEGLLGKGGMGHVYRAFDAKLERRVALKILSTRVGDEDAGPDVTVRRILREARAAAQLAHPNTVAVFEVGEHDGEPFMAMELIQGHSLRMFVGAEGFSLPQRIFWLGEVGKALAAAHKAGIVHLDIKPENVMVRDDGVVKVLDFGVARRSALDFEHSDVVEEEVRKIAMLTQAGRLAGTVPYMAPEQLKLQTVDGRTDQFAWGVVAYELLSGQMPWPLDQGSYKLIQAILESPPPRLGSLVPALPEAVEAVVHRALSKNPEDRFESMEELVFSLSEVAPPWRPLRSILPPPVTPMAPTVAALDRALADTRIDSQLDATGVKDAVRTPGDEVSGALSDATIDEGRTVAPPRMRHETEAPVSSSDRPPANSDKPQRQRGVLFASLASIMSLAAVASFVVLLVAGKIQKKERTDVLTPPAPSSPPIVPTALTDLPPPSGCTKIAADAFRDGMHAMHDGNWEQAYARFESASKDDPRCAPVALRLAMTSYYHRPISEAREVYQHAMQVRAGLDERDRLMLEALDPLIRNDPSDLRAAGERFAALSGKFPGDAEIAFFAARMFSDEPARKVVYARRAIGLDPKYSDAWQTLGEGLAAEQKVGEALDALEKCVQAVPSSVDCVRTRATLLRRTGRCEEAAATARIWIARDPSTSGGYLALAHALAQGSSSAPVQEALRQRWSRLREADRAQRSLYEQALLDALHGHFDEAEKRTAELERLVSGSSSLEVHVLPIMLEVSILAETGHLDEAGKRAMEALDRASAWSSSLLSESLDVPTYSFEPRMLHMAFRAGAIDEASYRRRLDVWARGARAGRVRGEEIVWALSSAIRVDTPAEAAEALAVMPASVKNNGGKLGIWPVMWGPYGAKALLQDGRIDEAIAQLRDSTAACTAFIEPIVHTRAHLWLGEALEKKGDTKGACDAYAVVASRWGHATPRSTTAQEAQKRSVALGCAR